MNDQNTTLMLKLTQKYHMPVVDISCWPYLVVQPLCSYSECDCSPTRRWAQEQSGEQRHFLINTLSLIICSLYHTRGYWVFLHCSAEHNHLLHFHFWQHQHDFLFKTRFRKRKTNTPSRKRWLFLQKPTQRQCRHFLLGLHLLSGTLISILFTFDVFVSICLRQLFAIFLDRTFTET